MHGLCICILHNSETLEPLTWIRIRPSHRYAHTLSLSLSLSLPLFLAHTYVVSCPWNISKYTTFKPITRLVLSYINLATYLTLVCTRFKYFWNAVTPEYSNQYVSRYWWRDNYSEVNLMKSLVQGAAAH